MSTKLRYIAPLLASAAAGVAIAVAPTAAAYPTQRNCTYLDISSTQCQSPGNVQVNDSPGYVPYVPSYPYFAGPIFVGGQGHGGMGGHR